MHEQSLSIGQKKSEGSGDQMFALRVDCESVGDGASTIRDFG